MGTPEVAQKSKAGSAIAWTPETEMASQAQRDFLNTKEMRELVDKEVVSLVIVDPTTVPVSLEVEVNDITYGGMGAVEYVQARLPEAYEGFPVRVTAEKLDSGDSFGILSKPADKSSTR
jgi:hypothetical protein